MNEISTLERKVRMLQISWYTRPAGHDFVKICPCINRIMQESFFDKKKKKKKYSVESLSIISLVFIFQSLLR
jgi:hypothetical protein